MTKDALTLSVELDTTQIADFLISIAGYSYYGASQGAINDLLDSGDMVDTTQESIDELFARFGRKLDENGVAPGIPFERRLVKGGKGGYLFVWESVTLVSGEPAGKLYSRDYGSIRALYFDNKIRK